LQLFLGLRVADQVGELTAEPVVILAVLIDAFLLIALAAQVVDELTLGFVKTAADTLSEIAHGVELLHTFRVVFGKHVFPLLDFLLVRDFLHAQEEFGAASVTP